jgi:hypothetical protein
MAEAQDTNCIDAADTQRAQEALGCCLCCARAVDCTALPGIGTLATQQAEPAIATLKGLTQLLNCAATHSGAEMRFRASDVVLRIDSDASCLSESKARSRVAGCHCLGSHPDKLQGKPPPFNGSANALFFFAPSCARLHPVPPKRNSAPSSTTARKHAQSEQRSRKWDIHNPQLRLRLTTDNNAAAGTANGSAKQKRSKAMDMRFCWVHDRVRQGQFHIAWRKGALNKADHFSKHHPTARHHDLRSACLHEPPSRNSNCFDCLRDDDDDYDSDAVATSNESASATLHARPKALRSSAAPAGEGVLIPPCAGHASHAACACMLSQTLEQTCKAAALLRSFSAAQPL